MGPVAALSNEDDKFTSYVFPLTKLHSVLTYIMLDVDTLDPTPLTGN